MMTPRSIGILIVFLAAALTAGAQPGGGGDPGGGEPVPFSGLEVLLTAGAVLGAKALHTLRKRTKSN
jgi:hypothetical protein